MTRKPKRSRLLPFFTVLLLLAIIIPDGFLGTVKDRHLVDVPCTGSMPPKCTFCELPIRTSMSVHHAKCAKRLEQAASDRQKARRQRDASRQSIATGEATDAPTGVDQESNVASSSQPTSVAVSTGGPMDLDIVPLVPPPLDIAPSLPSPPAVEPPETSAAGRTQRTTRSRRLPGKYKDAAPESILAMLLADVAPPSTPGAGPTVAASTSTTTPLVTSSHSITSAAEESQKAHRCRWVERDPDVDSNSEDEGSDINSSYNLYLADRDVPNIVGYPTAWRATVFILAGESMPVVLKIHDPDFQNLWWLAEDVDTRYSGSWEPFLREYWAYGDLDDLTSRLFPHSYGFDRVRLH